MGYLFQKFPGTLLPSTFYSPDNPEELRARNEVGRRGKYIEIMESMISQDHPALVQLVKQCLHNAPDKRPKSNELLVRLQRMKVEMDGAHGGGLLNLEAKLATKVYILCNRIVQRMHIIY